VPQPVDLVVAGRVLLDVRIGPGEVGLRLEVVVVADEVLDRVVREELLELLVELRGQRLVVRHDEGRLLDGLDQFGRGVGVVDDQTAEPGQERLRTLHGEVVDVLRCCRTLVDGRDGGPSAVQHAIEGIDGIEVVGREPDAAFCGDLLQRASQPNRGRPSESALTDLDIAECRPSHAGARRDLALVRADRGADLPKKRPSLGRQYIGVTAFDRLQDPGEPRGLALTGEAD
jgi:hypothetical protein